MTSSTDESQTLFNIEGFFRTRSNYNTVLKLDEIILRTNVNDDEKMVQVHQLIEETLKTVKKGVTENEWKT